jgi:Rrf2 family protein
MTQKGFTEVFTAKVQYALILLQELYSAKVNGELGPVKLRDVAKRHGLKLEFLEKVARSLRKGDMVIATKGPGGGYMLKSANPTSVKEVFQCVQPEADLKLAAEGEQAQEYIRDLYAEYLVLIGELEV